MTADDQRGFTLLELLVAIGIAATMSAIVALAVRGFADTGTAARCRADTTRLRKAESSFFVAHDRYADETELVAGALLDAPSALHDVDVAGGAYTISEVGTCIGQGTAYGIPAPTVGVSAHSGTTVAVVAPDGTGVAGATASYVLSSGVSGGASWTAMGPTDVHGSVSAPLADGVYDIRVEYDGALDTLSQVSVTNGTVVTFPAVPLTVRLRDAAGTGVSGGAVAIQANGGAPVSVATTTASGDAVVDVLPAAYDVTLGFGGMVSTHSAIAVTAPTVVEFDLCAATVRVLSVNGSGVSSAQVSARAATGGETISLGTTDATGGVTGTLLDGTYDFTVHYQSETSTQTASVHSGTTVTFRMAQVTVVLAQSSGAALYGGDAALSFRPTGSGAWISIGAPNPAGASWVEVLPATYDFQGQWFGHTGARTGVAISADTTVTVQTIGIQVRMLSSAGAPLSGQDALVWARAAGDSTWTTEGAPNASGAVTVELFPGSYDFEARWFGVVSVQANVTIAAGSSVTFRTTAATSQLLASNGAALSGQDAAFFFRLNGAPSWTHTGAPDASGTGVQELFPATYDFEARWFGVTVVRTAVAVVAAAPPTLTFTTTRATLRMLSSTGAGLGGQDEAMWVRQTGSSTWMQTDAPSGGAVAQELFVATYDVQSRWFGVFAQQSSVSVNGPTTVTFTSVPVTLRMLTSTGAGLTGRDEAISIRPSGTSTFTSLGPPAANGVLVQELFAATYDARFRWTSSTTVSASNVVSGPTTVTVSAVAVALTCRRQSDGAAISGATGSVINGGVQHSFGTSDGSGLVTIQQWAGTHDFRCRFGVLVGTNTNVNVPVGGGATTVYMS